MYISKILRNTAVKLKFHLLHRQVKRYGGKMIFFDLDGTLIDHKKAEVLGVKGFFNKYSNCFSFNEDLFYENWCNISDKHFLRFLSREISFTQQRTERIKDVFSLSGIKLSDDEADIKFKVYRKFYEDNLMPYDDVILCLNSLKGERLGIISNGDLSQQMFKLQRIGKGNYFDTIITAGDVGVAKPHIDIFKIACKKANVHVEDCIYIGDDFETDILSCKEAGMEGIWLNRKHELLKHPETKMIYDLKMLESFL